MKRSTEFVNELMGFAELCNYKMYATHYVVAINILDLISGLLFIKALVVCRLTWWVAILLSSSISFTSDCSALFLRFG